MTIVLARPLLAAVLLAALAAAGGCQRKSGGESNSADDAPDNAEAEVAAPPVLRWDCDGGLTLTTKRLPRDDAISLGLHEGERKLPHVISGSGEKYQDGPITFWRNGDTAIYERTPAPPVGCRLAVA
jgi:membrane-bound inhibitor of C-type lysozyme